MQVFNIRFGFATNSSSTHSIVRIPHKSSVFPSDSDVSTSEFGWGYFVCSSLEAKQRYLTCLLRHHFAGQADADSIDLEYFRFLIGISESEFNSALDGYIDHQSVISLPRNFNGFGLDLHFFRDFCQFILSPDVVILGGNDNDDYQHPLLTRVYHDDLYLPFFLDSSCDPVVARWDETYKYWTMFNRRDGTKVRFSFDSTTPIPKRSEVPELVDIKITDRCFAQCPFCYQNSTPDGEEADTGYIYFLSDTLRENRVFEVALGGGEPTTHPGFIHIIKMFKSRGVIPNFTTRSLAWFKDQSFVSILPNIGSFALSVNNYQQIKQLRTILDYNEDVIASLRDGGLKVNIHIVMGLHSDWEFRSLIRECLTSRFTPVLLGFKNVGRGKNVQKKPYDNWFDSVQQAFDDEGYGCRIGLDTCMVSEFKSVLQEHEISERLYHDKEGVFSCYIDAVGKTCNVSSFSRDKPKSLTYNEMDDFQNIYRSLVK